MYLILMAENVKNIDKTAIILHIDVVTQTVTGGLTMHILFYSIYLPKIMKIDRE